MPLLENHIAVVTGAASGIGRAIAAGYARDVLLSESGRSRGVLNPATVERRLQLHQRGRDLDLQLWTMLSFELWCRRFLDEPVTVAS